MNDKEHISECLVCTKFINNCMHAGVRHGCLQFESREKTENKGNSKEVKTEFNK